MNSLERREYILKTLETKNEPVSGTTFANELSVSRQVIVQDIALLKNSGHPIISTHNGYILKNDNRPRRIFKVYHTDEETQEELNLFVDLGGKVEDVFVYHKVFGVVKGVLNIKSRRDVELYIESLRSGKSTQLKNITSNYHYHTVSADDTNTLDIIQEKLYERGFLAKLTDYEPL